MYPIISKCQNIRPDPELASLRNILLQIQAVLLGRIVLPRALLFVKVLKRHPQPINIPVLQTLQQKREFLIHSPTPGGQDQQIDYESGLECVLDVLGVAWEDVVLVVDEGQDHASVCGGFYAFEIGGVLEISLIVRE